MREEPFAPGDHRWWTILRGTAWTVVDAEAMSAASDRARVVARMEQAVKAGGLVRPASPEEVTAWTELQASLARLRGAGTRAERLDALGVVDLLDAEQEALFP